VDTEIGPGFDSGAIRSQGCHFHGGQLLASMGLYFSEAYVEGRHLLNHGKKDFPSILRRMAASISFSFIPFSL
jgi:hypothetical protein